MIQVVFLDRTWSIACMSVSRCGVIVGCCVSVGGVTGVRGSRSIMGSVGAAAAVRTMQAQTQNQGCNRKQAKIVTAHIN